MPTPQIQQIRELAEGGQVEAQFLLSQIYSQSGDMEGSVHWLLQASNSGMPDALDALGHCYEKGLGIPRDLDAALAHYTRAIQGGAVQAGYRKAELLYKSRRGPENESLIRDLLLAATSADVVPALRTVGYLGLQHASSRDVAISCLRRAAELGDPVSSFNLAWCMAQGWSDQHSESEAARCLECVTAAEYPFAETLHAQLQDLPAISRPQSLEQPPEAATTFSLFPKTQDLDHQVLSTDPPVKLFNEVLNIVDCAYLIFLSRPYLKRADVVDPDSQKDSMISSVRTSMSTYLPFGIVDIIGRCIELKIINETGGDLAASEPMSILRYAPGEYYRPHFDYFDPKINVSQGLMEDGGQRTASVVTYLASPSAGGGTSFPRLKLSVPPIAGSSLWFRNCRDDGQVDSRSLHAGEPVEQGEKWVVTKWFRERPTQYLEL